MITMSTDPHVPANDPHSSTPLDGPLDPVAGGTGYPDALPHDPADHSASEAPPPPENAVKFTRAAALWSALVVGFLILIVLLVFILQNTDSTTVHLFGWAWSLPVGVAILLAAVGGGLVTFLAGTVRIIQLRRAAKKNYKVAKRAVRG
jgi:uncharacterized integral membrane protein